MITSAVAIVCMCGHRAHYTRGKCRYRLVASLAAGNTGGKSTLGCRIKVAGGECHTAEDFAGVACGVGKNVAFAVGYAVFGRIDEERNGAFNLYKREQT